MLNVLYSVDRHYSNDYIYGWRYILQLELELLVIITALHGMQTRSYDENSVRPSVCPSDAWIVTKRQKDIFRFLYDTKGNLS